MDTLETVTKVCTKCGETKVWDAFGKDKRYKYEKSPYCKMCKRIMKANYKKDNQEIMRAAWARYRNKHPEIVHVNQAKNRARSRISLDDVYILKCMKMKRGEVTLELISLKREQLTIYHMARELKESLTKETK